MLPQPEVHRQREEHLQAVLYRQLVAACRARRAADPYVVMERLPEGHPEAVSCRQPGAWSLPRPPAGAVRAERPAVPAWVLQAQRPG